MAPRGSIVRGSSALVIGVVIGCAPRTTPTTVVPPGPRTTPASGQEPLSRRHFAPVVAGEPVFAGISYGPYREDQRPGGPDPTRDQILEDLRLLAPRWHMIRFYSSRGPAEDILATIRDHELPIVAMVGVWIASDAATENAAEVEEAIRLVNAYSDQVVAVSVGNETQVSWSSHRMPPSVLVEHIRTVRASVSQPVTTADDYNFWNKPESHAVADEVDFLLLHAYAMWNQVALADAVSWTATTVDAITSEHPDLAIVLGETGWATELNPEGREVQYIRALAGEVEQAAFFRGFTAWATEAAVPYFYFEAFDEPWKGGSDAREVEKHWGLYDVNRQAKAALFEE